MPLKTTVLVNLITFINHRLPKFQSSKPETETKERERQKTTYIKYIKQNR